MLTNLEEGDVLFIDEIHRLNPVVEEVLYPAMEDRALDLIIGEGPSARSVRIDLPQFTLIGATTRQGLLTTPLRDRFRHSGAARISTATEELEQVVHRAAQICSISISPPTAPPKSRAAPAGPRASLAVCCAGFVILPMSQEQPYRSTGKLPMNRSAGLEVDSIGLDAMDRRYLHMIADIYKGGPVGVETLAAGLSEPRDTVEEVIEPYLIQLGLVARTARGRALNDRGWQHLGLKPPAGKEVDGQLFD